MNNFLHSPDFSQITERAGEPATRGKIADMLHRLQRVLRQAPSSRAGLWYRSGSGHAGCRQPASGVSGEDRAFYDVLSQQH